MSNGFYEFQVVGVLIKNPEIKTSKTGSEYAVICIGTTRSEKKGDQWDNKKEYHNFIAGGKTVQYIKKLSKMDIVRATSNSISHSVSDDKKVFTNYMLGTINVISKASNQNFAKSEQNEDDIPVDMPF